MGKLVYGKQLIADPDTVIESGAVYVEGSRVVEVGVHGLDLADALRRRPWLTPAAARVVADLLVDGRPAPGTLGWDAVTLVRKATGRSALADRERAVLTESGFRWLSFGA